jgi:hypothetical protein
MHPAWKSMAKEATTMFNNNNSISNIIKNIMGDAHDEAKIASKIASIPGMENVKSWTSYDRYSMSETRWCETKELHWSFCYAGVSCELKTVHDGKFKLTTGDESHTFYWSVSDGSLCWEHKMDNKLNSHIGHIIFDIIWDLSSKREKFHMDKNMSYGPYIIWAKDATIMVENAKTKKTYMIGHTPLGYVRYDSDIPQEILGFIKRNFLRK